MVSGFILGSNKFELISLQKWYCCTQYHSGDKQIVAVVNLREFVSINTDVVTLVSEDLCVGITTGWGGDGRGHEESEDDEL